jgi:hypothetical protein
VERGGVALSEGKIVSELAISLGQGFELDRARREIGPRVRQFEERGDRSEDRVRESATEIGEKGKVREEPIVPGG